MPVSVLNKEIIVMLYDVHTFIIAKNDEKDAVADLRYYKGED